MKQEMIRKQASSVHRRRFPNRRRHAILRAATSRVRRADPRPLQKVLNLSLIPLPWDIRRNFLQRVQSCSDRQNAGFEDILRPQEHPDTQWLRPDPVRELFWTRDRIRYRNENSQIRQHNCWQPEIDSLHRHCDSSRNNASRAASAGSDRHACKPMQDIVLLFFAHREAKTTVRESPIHRQLEM